MSRIRYRSRCCSKPLRDHDQHIRAWAIQLLCEDSSPSPKTLDTLLARAEVDESSVVRLYLASALQRIPDDWRFSIASKLVQHEADIDDHNIPKMLWFGIEPLVANNPDEALELAVNSKLPNITTFVARRLADADNLEPIIRAVADHESHREQLLLGMRDGLEGRTDVKAPSNWAAAYVKLPTSGDIGRLAVELAQQFGDSTAADQLLATLKDADAPLETSQTIVAGADNAESRRPARRVAATIVRRRVAS